MTIELLPDRLMMRGGDPDLLGKELLSIISHAISHHPRSLQQEIGPSEIGCPCARRIGYKLLRAPTLNTFAPPNWKAFLGVCVHEKMEKIFAANNLFYRTWVDESDDRWLIEQKVTCGWVGPDELDGHSDLYDRVTCTIIDWKVVGPTPLKTYRSQGPGQQYRTQGHTYGRGFAQRGLPVDTVMIVFLPRNGELMTDTHIWHEPYDEQVALAGLARVNAIRTVTETRGVEGLTLLPTAEAYCHHCPYLRRDATHPKDGCPGHPSDKPPPRAALTLEGK